MLILLKVSSSFINLVDILFVVEMSDNKLKSKIYIEAMCETWLNLIPKGNLLLFSDTSINLPKKCRNFLNIKKSLECCDNSNFGSKLGDNILSAQMKREYIYQKIFLKKKFLIEKKNIKWIVSTEQDVWWNVNRIPDYINSRMIYLSLNENKIVFGHWVGPFQIMNINYLYNFVGNITYLNLLKNDGLYNNLDYLKTTKRKGSQYHNDHLVFSSLVDNKNKNDVHIRLCTERTDISNYKIMRKFELSSYIFYANAANMTPQIVFSNFSHQDKKYFPKKLIAYHRFGEPHNLRYLHNFYYKQHEQNQHEWEKRLNVNSIDIYDDNFIENEIEKKREKLLKLKQMKFQKFKLNITLKNEDMYKAFNETKYVLTKLNGNNKKLSQLHRQYMKNMDLYEKKCFLVWNKLL